MQIDDRILAPLFADDDATLPRRHPASDLSSVDRLVPATSHR